MKRGNLSTGVPNGGCPQSGGQTVRGVGGVSSLNTTTAATISTPTPAANCSSSRRCDVWLTGGAAYDPGGSAYPGQTVSSAGAWLGGALTGRGAVARCARGGRAGARPAMFSTTRG